MVPFSVCPSPHSGAEEFAIVGAEVLWHGFVSPSMTQYNAIAIITKAIAIFDKLHFPTFFAEARFASPSGSRGSVVAAVS